MLPPSLNLYALAWGFALRIWGPTDRMRHEIELWAPWMSEDDTEERLIEINLTPVWQRKPTKGTLGERLQLTYAERARLDLRTIGPCDMSEGAMALIRKQNRRKRERLRRQKRGARSQANSISRTKPWIAAGFNTRRTWERKGKPLVATSCSINLSTTEHEPATAGECEVAYSSLASSLCVRLSTATTAWPTGTYDDPWAEEAAWQSTWEQLEAAA